MPSKTRATPFSRFLIVLAVMAALFFGARYALEETPWGRRLHADLQEAAPGEAPADEAAERPAERPAE